jgi:hypothetical protein
MHAQPLPPHAQKKFSNNFEKWKSYAKQRDTACTVREKYDTTFTIDERFERPWQPLKGISIKNKYVPALPYPTTKNIYKFKGVT